MTALTPVRLHRGFSEVVEREARAVHAQCEEAPDELDAFIDAEANQPETVRRLWSQLWENGKSATHEDVLEIEAEFRRLFDAALAALCFLRDWAEQFQKQTGRKTKQADLLEQTWQVLTELQTKIMADIDWLNRPAQELTDAQYEEIMADRGEAVDVEDIIRELQGDPNLRC